MRSCWVPTTSVDGFADTPRKYLQRHVEYSVGAWDVNRLNAMQWKNVERRTAMTNV
jgi:hypothetical protein